MKRLMEGWRKFTEDTSKEVPDEVVSDLLQQLSDEGISIEDAEEYLKNLQENEEQSLEEGAMQALAKYGRKYGAPAILAALMSVSGAMPSVAQAAGPDMHGYSDTMKSAPSLAFAGDADFGSTLDKTMLMMVYNEISGQTAGSAEVRDLQSKMKTAALDGADNFEKLEKSIVDQGGLKREAVKAYRDAVKKVESKDNEDNLIKNSDMAKHWDSLMRAGQQRGR